MNGVASKPLSSRPFRPHGAATRSGFREQNRIAGNSHLSNPGPRRILRRRTGCRLRRVAERLSAYTLGSLMTERRTVNHGDDGEGLPPPGDEPTDPRADLPATPDARITPEVVASFRSQLTVGEDAVDPSTWAGSVPVAHGIAPRVRIGSSRWSNLLWLLPIGFVVLIIAVAATQGLRDMSSV